MRSTLIGLFLIANSALSAQWISGGMFSVFNHFHAAAFHTADTGLFVYGSDNPISGEGGIIATYSAATSGGFYLWYEQPMIIEDVHVVVKNGFPYYMAAGSQSYGYSVVLKPNIQFQNPFQFDSVRTASSQYYRTIRMRNDLVAFAGGGDAFGNGIIDMSSDTAASWSNVTLLPGQPVSRIRFATDSIGFATSGGYSRLNNNGINLPDSGAIYRSTDGGMNWSQVHADASNGFSDVSFFNAFNGVASRNDGAILFSNDGGTSWQNATINYSDSVVLSAVTFRSDGFAFATGFKTDGSEGVVFISGDQGATWDLNFSTASLNHARRIYGINFFDLGTGYLSAHIRPLKNDGISTSVMNQTRLSASKFSFDMATGMLSIPESSESLEVFDTEGRLIRTMRTTGSDNIRLQLEPGVYLLSSLQVDGQVHSESLFLF